MQPLTIRLKCGKPQKRFSEAFKKEVVRDYERGVLNKDQIQIKYGLAGNSTVSRPEKIRIFVCKLLLSP